MKGRTNTLFILLMSVYGFANSNGNNFVNEYFDTVLNTALQMELGSLGLDPVFLPDFDTDFDDRIKLIGRVHGIANFYDGQLGGLGNARRKGDCSGPFLDWNMPFINCSLGLDDLKIYFKGKLKYGKLPTVSITARANLTSTLMSVIIANYPINVNNLRSVSFLKIGQIQPKFTGLGSPLNKYLDVLEKGFIDHAWPAVINMISLNFLYALQNAVFAVPFMWYTAF
ncbi:uncharacterized protein [Parasteatoda tepidariorum]|uniref:uncharacterized protein n=1 Tax=Parasteatoda tepidariorum TaxID=114398 RepID=UPI00077FD702|nr:uncharacterized protein LOC107450355 [Parasteatoda tepidariorum]